MGEKMTAKTRLARSAIMRPSWPRIGVAFGLALALQACSEPAPGALAHDPFEAGNRRVHTLNKEVDTAVLRPVALTYDAITPAPADIMVGNFSSNLSLPGQVVNRLLQFDIPEALKLTTRFAVNSTFGIGGLFDPASDLKLTQERSTDFGETLHIWGAKEGAYVELPLLGPSTTRDTVGRVVDIFLDPVGAVAPRDITRLKTGGFVLDRIGDRADYDAQIEEILYHSPDSYISLRNAYLQQRRAALAKDRSEIIDLEDPYAITEIPSE